MHIKCVLEQHSLFKANKLFGVGCDMCCKVLRIWTRCHVDIKEHVINFVCGLDTPLLLQGRV